MGILVGWLEALTEGMGDVGVVWEEFDEEVENCFFIRFSKLRIFHANLTTLEKKIWLVLHLEIKVCHRKL